MTLEKMVQLCKNLTPIEITIANYVLQNTELALDMTIQELSDLLFVSKSAIHRFCKKVGLKGYNDLKIRISKDRAEMMSKQSNVDVNYPFFALDTPREIAFKLLDLYEITIKDTFECIDESILQESARLLNHASVIDIYTHAHNSSIAENFQDKMLSIGRVVNCPKTFYNQRLHALASQEKHVAIILSYSGKASWILSIIKKLNEKNIDTILISKIGSNHYSQYITQHLAISDNEELQDRISQFSSHIALQYMMDILYSCVYNLDRNKNIQYFYDSIDYMDDRKIDGIKK